jgi:hypothetical protein
MKCPACVEEGEKSMVSGGFGTTTCAYYAPFYDEEGRSHHHAGNTSTAEYACSRGHQFTVSSSGSCWCGWNKDVLPKVYVRAPDGGKGRFIEDAKVLAEAMLLPSSPLAFSITGT